jgi:hypothetical protein
VLDAFDIFTNSFVFSRPVPVSSGRKKAGVAYCLILSITFKST